MQDFKTQYRMQSSNGKIKIYALDYLIIFFPALLMSFIYLTFRAVQTICYQQVLACIWTPFPSGMVVLGGPCTKLHVCALKQMRPQFWTPQWETQAPTHVPQNVLQTPPRHRQPAGGITLQATRATTLIKYSVLFISVKSSGHSCSATIQDLFQLIYNLLSGTHCIFQSGKEKENELWIPKIQPPVFI